MKAKIVRGSGFRGALDYAFDVGPKATDDKQPERIGGTLSGKTPRVLAHELAVVRGLRPDIERPVWHCSLSLPEGERLSKEKWDAVTRDFMRQMKFSNLTPYVVVRHGDTKHDHVHIIASRIGLDGKVWGGQWEAKVAINATQKLERTHGLQLTKGLGRTRAKVNKLTDGELKMEARTQVEAPKRTLQRWVREAAEGKPTVRTFVQRLRTFGVKTRANVAKTGRMNGFSFELDGVAFKGSQLGKDFSWAGLQKQGVRHELPLRGPGIGGGLKATREVRLEGRPKGLGR